MKALICPSLGPPENLKVMDVEPPVPAEGEVVVEVAYAALNFMDTLIIEGKYQLKPAPPFSPAGEFSGRVVALGPGVKRFAVGDRVMGSSGFGAARERIAFPASRLAHVPDGLPLDKAAGLSIAYGTTLHALKQRAEMKPGETLVVLGASGGVGLAAVEIGRVDGGARHRLRLFRRQARLRPPLRRLGDDQLRDRGSARTAQGADRRQGRRRRLRSGRRRRSPSLPCARSAGRGGFW